MAAAEVEKYDNMPNAKGKVKPRYTNIADQLYTLRGQLINGGIYYQGARMMLMLISILHVM